MEGIVTDTPNSSSREFLTAPCGNVEAAVTTTDVESEQKTAVVDERSSGCSAESDSTADDDDTYKTEDKHEELLGMRKLSDGVQGKAELNTSNLMSCADGGEKCNQSSSERATGDLEINIMRFEPLTYSTDTTDPSVAEEGDNDPGNTDSEPCSENGEKTDQSFTEMVANDLETSGFEPHSESGEKIDPSVTEGVANDLETSGFEPPSDSGEKTDPSVTEGVAKDLETSGFEPHSDSGEKTDPSVTEGVAKDLETSGFEPHSESGEKTDPSVTEGVAKDLETSGFEPHSDSGEKTDASVTEGVAKDLETSGFEPPSESGEKTDPSVTKEVAKEIEKNVEITEPHAENKEKTDLSVTERVASHLENAGFELHSESKEIIDLSFTEGFSEETKMESAKCHAESGEEKIEPSFSEGVAGELRKEAESNSSESLAENKEKTACKETDGTDVIHVLSDDEEELQRTATTADCGQNTVECTVTFPTTQGASQMHQDFANLESSLLGSYAINSSVASRFKQNARVCHGDGRFCVECGQTFSQQFQFSDHISCHWVGALTAIGQCALCGILFTHGLVMAVHLTSAKDRMIAAVDLSETADKGKPLWKSNTSTVDNCNKSNLLKKDDTAGDSQTKSPAEESAPGEAAKASDQSSPPTLVKEEARVVELQTSSKRKRKAPDMYVADPSPSFTRRKSGEHANGRDHPRSDGEREVEAYLRSLKEQGLTVDMKAFRVRPHASAGSSSKRQKVGDKLKFLFGNIGGCGSYGYVLPGRICSNKDSTSSVKTFLSLGSRRATGSRPIGTFQNSHGKEIKSQMQSLAKSLLENSSCYTSGGLVDRAQAVTHHRSDPLSKVLLEKKKSAVPPLLTGICGTFGGFQKDFSSRLFNGISLQKCSNQFVSQSQSTFASGKGSQFVSPPGSKLASGKGAHIVIRTALSPSPFIRDSRIERLQKRRQSRQDRHGCKRLRNVQVKLRKLAAPYPSQGKWPVWKVNLNFHGYQPSASRLCEEHMDLSPQSLRHSSGFSGHPRNQPESFKQRPRQQGGKAQVRPGLHSLGNPVVKLTKIPVTSPTVLVHQWPDLAKPRQARQPAPMTPPAPHVSGVQRAKEDSRRAVELMLQSIGDPAYRMSKTGDTQGSAGHRYPMNLLANQNSSLSRPGHRSLLGGILENRVAYRRAEVTRPLAGTGRAYSKLPAENFLHPGPRGSHPAASRPPPVSSDEVIVIDDEDDSDGSHSVMERLQTPSTQQQDSLPLLRKQSGNARVSPDRPGNSRVSPDRPGNSRVSPERPGNSRVSPEPSSKNSVSVWELQTLEASVIVDLASKLDHQQGESIKEGQDAEVAHGGSTRSVVDDSGEEEEEEQNFNGWKVCKAESSEESDGEEEANTSPASDVVLSSCSKPGSEGEDLQTVQPSNCEGDSIVHHNRPVGEEEGTSLQAEDSISNCSMSESLGKTPQTIEANRKSDACGGAGSKNQLLGIEEEASAEQNILQGQDNLSKGVGSPLAPSDSPDNIVNKTAGDFTPGGLQQSMRERPVHREAVSIPPHLEDSTNLQEIFSEIEKTCLEMQNSENALRLQESSPEVNRPL